MVEVVLRSTKSVHFGFFSFVASVFVVVGKISLPILKGHEKSC